jgi:hypothetical protein
MLVINSLFCFYFFILDVHILILGYCGKQPVLQITLLQVLFGYSRTLLHYYYSYSLFLDLHC